MLADKDALATIAVKDIASARAFYEGKLGFKPSGAEDSEVVTYKSGNSTLLVYRAEFAGTNKATSATWGVGGELDAIVKTLSGKGVRFEHYDFPGGKRDGDVHMFGEFRAAWFTDPDGNILHVNNG
jgi:catechol 2,3-dioxygenase-like lactoylglutathione lyase family enzyme